ncbi:MAG TPA: histidinol-phosphate transaminase [Polyangiaceae bacterium]|nr:histidinol-phosphate transaminase [Polyangiaceae bacterium]
MPPLALEEMLRPELSEVQAYRPVVGDFRVRLDANEAPPLLGPGARQRLAEVSADTRWERYPDAASHALRAAIAAKCRVSSDEVLVGVGSDELITLLLTALSVPRDKTRAATLITTTPTFVMYRMSARIRGLQVLEVPLDEEWDVSVPSLLRAIELSTPNLIFIASPNNPTGNLASRDRVERVIQAAAGALVVIDEAYVDYSDSDQLDLYRKYDNVAVLRTLSKIGFAALRVGWLLGRPELVRELDKARLPYNLNSLSQRLGTVVLSELSADVDATLSAVRKERERLASALIGMNAISVTPSQANFIWFRTQRAASEVFEGLMQRQVLVRSFHGRGGRLKNQLRVTVGTASENEEFLQALREVV